MKLSLKVEYACRVLAQLSRTYGNNKFSHIDALAKMEEIPANYLVQILNELRNGGLINSRRGKQGGYSLAKPPSEITLYEVVTVIDGELLGINLGVVILFALAAYRVAVSISRPIEALTETARKISEDEPDVVIPENSARDEVGVLTRTFSKMTARLASKAEDLERSRAETERAVQQMREKNAELQRVNEVLEQLSITDGLTQLHNHRFFQERLDSEIARAQRYKTPLCLAMIDIDDFKSVNDNYGHQAGDAVLRAMAGRLGALVRNTDIVSRYGGEEFGVIYPDTPLQPAAQSLDRARGTIATTNIILVEDDQDDLRVTFSGGIAAYTGQSKDRFLREADLALYQSKDRGKNCITVAGSTDWSSSGDNANN